MRVMRRLVRWFSVLLLVVGAGFAQADTCPTLERAAVAEARIWCMDTQTGEACYGNSLVSAEAAGFQAAGDRIGLEETDRITTQVDAESNRYGVSVLRTLAYAPGSWTARPTTMVLLGNASLINTADNTPHQLATINSAQGVNVRALPTEDGRLIMPLFDGEMVMLTGRLADGSWLRVLLPRGQTGWITGQAIAEFPADLPSVAADSSAPEAIYEPFADFDLATATTDARCAEAWESGLLLQTAGEGFLRLRANGEAFTLDGTAFLQADAESGATLHVIAGEAQLGELLVREGYQVSLPLTDDPTPYEFARMAYLPTEILPEYVYIGLDLQTIITPAPGEDRSPIADVLATDRCILTTGPGGANLRGGPGTEFAVRGVLAFRETAYPVGRAMGSDGAIWWELAQNVWISSATTVTGGDCVAVPQSSRIPALPPTPTPEAE